MCETSDDDDLLTCNMSGSEQTEQFDENERKQ
jgi:hypothetical protein